MIKTFVAMTVTFITFNLLAACPNGYTEKTVTDGYIIRYDGLPCPDGYTSVDLGSVLPVPADTGSDASGTFVYESCSI